MKLSQHFGRSLRPEATSTGIEGHDFLIRAGYVHPHSGGMWDILPLGMKLMHRFQSFWEQGMRDMGASEISLSNPTSFPTPALGHYDGTGDSIHTFEEQEKNFVLASSLLQPLLSLLQQQVNSYRQLPLTIWENRWAPFLSNASGPGLFSPLTPNLLEGWVIAPSTEVLSERMQELEAFTQSTLQKIGLPSISVSTDPGIVGAPSAKSWVFPSPHGEIQFQKMGDTQVGKHLSFQPFSAAPSSPLPIEKVHTPGTKTIQELAAFLHIPASQTAKVVFYHGSTVHHANPQLIIVVIRGDHEVNEIAVRRSIGASGLRTATEAEIEAIGAVPGYASPIGIQREDVLVLADEAVVQQANLVAGANEAEYHLRNTCYGRDYEADEVGNFRLAGEGEIGEKATIQFETGIELARLIHIGAKWPEQSDITFMGPQGKPEPVYLGYCRWNLSQLLAATAAHYHDEKGLTWPGSLTPYQIQLLSLADGEETIRQADRLYGELQKAGFSVLYDDRHKKVAGPGVKFTDADLRGIPIRITVAKRALKQGGVEWKMREQEERKIISIEEVVEKCRSVL